MYNEDTGLVVCDRRGNVERSVSTSANPSSLAAPAEWLIEALGGANNFAGIPVNRAMALSVSAVWKATALIATDVAKAPLNLYRTDGRSKTIVTDHPAAFLLRHEPNDQQSAFDYKQMRTFHKLHYGNSFAFKVMNGRGELLGLLPLLPDCVSMRQTRSGMRYDTTLYCDDGTAEQYELDSSQIIHETWLSFDGFNGMGLMGVAREVLARIVAMRNYGASVFKNSARPAVVIKSGQGMKEAERKTFIESWERMYSGTTNSHKTAVLPPGMEIETIGTVAREAQFIEQEQQCVRDVANFFMMPASKLNDMTKSSYNSLEQDNLAYFSDCLEGHLVSMEESCNKNLLTKQERMAGLAFEFDRSKIRVADLKTLGEYYSKMLGNNQAALTPNEVRSGLNLNPIEGGDVLPVNGAPPAPADEPKVLPEPEEDPELADSMRAVMCDSLRRAITRLVSNAKREFKKGGALAAMAAVDCRECPVTRENIDPHARAWGRIRRQERPYLELLTLDLSAAVRNAASKGPDEFEKTLGELTADIAERLVA